MIPVITFFAGLMIGMMVGVFSVGFTLAAKRTSDSQLKFNKDQKEEKE